MLSVAVDRNRCVGSALCVLVAPAVFIQDEDGFSQVTQASPVEAERAAAQEAADLCPVQAIRASLH